MCVVYFWFHIKLPPWEPDASLGIWSNARSLVDDVASRFPIPASTTESRSSQTLSHDFVGPNISRFYGVQINRTDSLDEHLQLDNFDPSIAAPPKESSIQSGQMTMNVFCDTRVLETLFTEKLDDGSPVCPLPRALYFEVSRSFGLLFPKISHCETYFGDTVSRNLSLYYFTAPRERNLSHYNVFKARLSVLLNIYNSPTIHWWHPLVDRRNKREHLTLWIAIWAFLFGVFSLLTGVVSGIYAVKQYDLGLAAACAESGDHPRMRKYCG
ncbi:hypothetical protein LZ32DRAFT_660246 [Colletotrichum eremochloae]|nr:hypothetical protein LZ32DRAFT_660246 [Colletotrichum eremochloae]